MADATEIADNSDAMVNEIVKLTERIYVKENAAMNDLCHKQTAVYNQALYLLRNEYFKQQRLNPLWQEYYTNKRVWLISKFDVANMMRWLPIYRDANPNCSLNTIIRAANNWKSYWKSVKKFNSCKNPTHNSLFIKGGKHLCHGCGYTGKPRMPYYIKKDEKSPIYFEYNQFRIKNNYIIFPKALNFESIRIKRLIDQKINDSTALVKQIRIIPCKTGGYWVECVHDVCIEQADVNDENVMGIDLGMNDLATIVDNLGNQPIAFSGNKAKTINHWYNIETAKLKKNFARSNPRLAELQRKREIGLSANEWREFKSLLQNTKQMNILTEKRNRRINKIFHGISKRIVDIAVERKIGKIVVGHNEGQKQNLDKGRRFNQNFGQLPIFKFIQKIRYKAELRGISIIEVTEEFTSKASVIDCDNLPDRRTVKKKENGHSDIEFSGKRMKRGLYVSKNGTQIHADVNGAYNILKKGCPEALGLNGMGIRLYPKRETI